MKIEKLNSGSYRVRKQINGKRYSATFDHRPGKREVEEYFRDVKEKNIAPLRFSEAFEQYLALKSNILSPSTIRGYRTAYKSVSEAFCKKDLYRINQNDIQAEVNALAGRLSSKTVRNIHGLITAVLRQFRSDMVITTTLPQKSKYEPYIPSVTDIQRILEEVKYTYLYIPVSLGCYGLRKSEILALSLADLEGNALRINKAAVLDSENNLVIKPMPKTTASNRTVYISTELADYIRAHGFCSGDYSYFHNSLSRGLKRVQKKLGITEFSFHKLRHFFASKMSTMTDMQTVTELGGWETSDTVKKIYMHSLENKQKKQNLSADFWFSIS